jgi:hypothetical protein
MQLRGSPAERELKEKMRANSRKNRLLYYDDCLGQSKVMTIDKVTVNLYMCCKCSYQWTSWNGEQSAEGGLVPFHFEFPNPFPSMYSLHEVHLVILPHSD